MANKPNSIEKPCEHCGKIMQTNSERLRNGRGKFCSRSCGATVTGRKHGHTTHDSQSRTYNTYQNMIARCHRESHSKYAMYGAKGIAVCQRWRASFQNFLEDMGERPEGKTIDRINGALGYYKENCRWADTKEQQANIKTNVNITFNGKTQNVSAWAKELGIASLAWRLRNGWSIENALTTQAQLGNRIRTTGQVILEYKGQSKNLSAWAKEYGMSIALLRLRLSKGWSIDKALETPKGKWNSGHVAAP